MAARGGRSGMRARIILALAEGTAPVEIVRRFGTSFVTIRAARRRFAAGGVASLGSKSPFRRTAPPPEGAEALRLRRGVPEVLLAREAEGKTGGRTPVVRLAIETWARDSVALGAVAPGALFPSRRNLEKTFRTTSTVVQGAFDSLARQGFAHSVPGGGSRAADPPPFAGRYLLVGTTDAERLHVGYMGAAMAAAHRLEKERGIRFDFVPGRILETVSKERMELLADIRAQRWAGVFMRTWTDEMARVGAAKIDNVPVCMPFHGMRRPLSFKGTRVAKIQNLDAGGILDRLLADCAGAGCRRVAVLDHQDRVLGFREAEISRRAAKHGLELGPWHYQAIRMVGETEGTHDAVRAVLMAMLAPGRDWNPDCILLMDDHWIEPLEEALEALEARGVPYLRQTERAKDGAASPIFVGCVGNKPALPPTRLDATFHGYDMEATLAGFIDWCDAIHAGVQDPPPPVIASF